MAILFLSNMPSLHFSPAAVARPPIVCISHRYHRNYQLLDRIVSALMPWVAPEHSLGSRNAPPPCSPTPECLLGIMRACRPKPTTVANKRGEGEAIYVDTPDQRLGRQVGYLPAMARPRTRFTPAAIGRRIINPISHVDVRFAEAVAPFSREFRRTFLSRLKQTVSLQDGLAA